MSDPSETGGTSQYPESLDDAGAAHRPVKSATAFRTISEVAAELAVPPHVLRFWESKFSQIRPMKRGGGRRYYRPDDVALLRRIRSLLYDDGMTIRGVQKILREGGARTEDQPNEGEAASAPGSVPAHELRQVLAELTVLRDDLRDALREP